MDSYQKINEYLDKRSNETGKDKTSLLMELAMKAGFEDFNPYRAEEYELDEIAEAI